MALELQDINPIILELHLTTSGGLQARHQTIELAAYGDAVLARGTDGVLRFELVAPAGWQVVANHENDEGTVVSWEPTPRGLAHDVTKPTTDPLEVTLTTSNAAEKKKKKLYIEAKPGGALPDRP
jgi:hypothetical protein